MQDAKLNLSAFSTQHAGRLHPTPNRHKNLTSKQHLRKSPTAFGIRRLAVGGLHGPLPIGAGIPWRNHSTTATSGSLCCHRWSLHRSFATSSRCSRCRRGHCACKRAEHLAIHSFVSTAVSPICSYCLFVQYMHINEKYKSNCWMVSFLCRLQGTGDCCEPNQPNYPAFDAQCFPTQRAKSPSQWTSLGLCGPYGAGKPCLSFQPQRASSLH